MTPCANCGNVHVYQKRIVFDEQGTHEMCDICANLRSMDASVHDVYFQRSGQTFSNLTDTMGNPIPIMSKRHKKEVMDKMGVREAGDRVGGAAYGTAVPWVEGTRAYRKSQFEKDRPAIQKVYRQYLQNVRRKP